MKRSVYVCRRCGLPVRLWGSIQRPYWKHSGGGGSAPSCGQRPDPVRRQDLPGDLDTVVRSS